LHLETLDVAHVVVVARTITKKVILKHSIENVYYGNPKDSHDGADNHRRLMEKADDVTADPKQVHKVHKNTTVTSMLILSPGQAIVYRTNTNYTIRISDQAVTGCYPSCFCALRVKSWSSKPNDQ
jgi:hypothetical protein